MNRRIFFTVLLSLYLATTLCGQEEKSVAEYQRSGTEHFRRGEIREAIADFDKAIALRPSYEAYHWQRGIAYYYAGEYQKGRRQFELHQTVNPNDVENAVWHFACIARADGLEAARKKMIEIRGDPRVPMSEIYSMFAGKMTPEDVLSAAAKGKPADAELRSRFFYAHLYIGLYEEVLGAPERSLEHMRKAAKEYSEEHYMGDVARVHLALLQKVKEPSH